MRSLLAAACLLILPAVTFAQKAEILSLSRDVALLQEEVRSNQKAQSDRLTSIEATLKAIQDEITSTSRKLTVLDTGMKDRMEKSMSGPLSGMGTKVDSLSQDFSYIRETVGEMNSRMGKLQQQMVDLGNTVKTMQAPPPPPSGMPSMGGAAPSSGPPAGVSAKTLYDDAFRDKSGGNSDLALKQFNDYLAWFGDTDMAPNAQYYIGEIYYNQKLNDEAVAAFDKVLEAYPRNAKTNDAHLMKGRALVRLGRRNDAVTEFREIIREAPNSEAASKARTELKALGVSTSSAPPPTTRKR